MKYIIVLAALLIQASCGSATPSDQDRLSHYIRANAYLVIDAVIDAVNEWTGSPELQDDMTLLVARRL